MRKVEPAPSPSVSTTIDEVELHTVTGGCAVGGCCGGGCATGGGYTYRQGGGFDPLMLVIAMQLFSNNK